MLIGIAALLCRLFFGEELDSLSFFQILILVCAIIIAALLYQISKRVDELGERVEARSNDDTEEEIDFDDDWTHDIGYSGSSSPVLKKKKKVRKKPKKASKKAIT